MYSTCLFCNSNLGRNDAIEHFTVGRRLAYDAGKGRLWVVCRRCGRWNLTPLETRWEAIEEAERAYRATRLRIATDNIGLAQLREGLELVRIGAPPKLEFAGWRYGDQFGKRRRRYLTMGAVGALAGAAHPAAQLLGFAGLPISGAVIVLGGGVSLVHSVIQGRAKSRDSKTAKIAIPSTASTTYRLTPDDTRAAELHPRERAGEWELKLRHKRVRSISYLPHEQPRPEPDSSSSIEILAGDAALRAMAHLLPHLNPAGAGKRGIRDAVKVIEDHSSLDRLLYNSAILNTRGYVHAADKARTTRHTGNVISTLPAEVRLALELVLHENDERRAMEGELQELEERWREAEEIAAIADSLLYPPQLEQRLEELRLRERKQIGESHT